MPELPEVETLRRGLEREVTNRRIVGVSVANAKILKGQTEAEFRSRVEQTRIYEVSRRGKYLLLALGDAPRSGTPETAATAGNTPEDSLFLCVHLKMRGQLLIRPASEEPGPYHCISLFLDNDRVIRFHDMWTWGEIRALTGGELAQVAGLAGMGEEPLTLQWNGTRLRAKLAGRKSAIKVALLDQSVVAGVGNIYADESLYRSGIHPQRIAGSLTEDEANRLAQTVQTVLGEAVNGGGTTSEEYVDLHGTAGRYTPDVYDRGGQPCRKCQTVLTRIRLGGRGTVFCAQCQPSDAAQQETK